MRDKWLVVGLIALLVGLTFVAALQQAGEREAEPYTTRSSAPDGLRALHLWLGELGYEASNEALSAFTIPPGAHTVLLVEPALVPTAREQVSLETWVEQGGTLLIAGSRPNTGFLLRRFGVELRSMTPAGQEVRALAPLMGSPPSGSSAPVRAEYLLDYEREDVLPLWVSEAGPVIARAALGRGQVIFSSTAHPFTNAGLKEAGNPELILNVLTLSGGDGVWFDEWHHGIRQSAFTVVGPGNWLRYTPTGHSLLYLAAVVFFALLLRGQHFGRPAPLPNEARRRGPVDQIEAIANLSRRARHRKDVLSQYRKELKRRLAARYRLDPGLPDQEFSAALRAVRPDLDTDDLRRLLESMREPARSEQEFVELARESSRWMQVS